MSKKIVFSIFDSSVGGFEDPFFLRSRGEGLRFWQTLCNDAKSAVCAHPNDFALMELGEFDILSGKFLPYAVPQNLGLAVQFKKTPVEELGEAFRKKNAEGGFPPLDMRSNGQA